MDWELVGAGKLQCPFLALLYGGKNMSTQANEHSPEATRSWLVVATILILSVGCNVPVKGEPGNDVATQADAGFPPQGPDAGGPPLPDPDPDNEPDAAPVQSGAPCIGSYSSGEPYSFPDGTETCWHNGHRSVCDDGDLQVSAGVVSACQIEGYYCYEEEGLWYWDGSGTDASDFTFAGSCDGDTTCHLYNMDNGDSACFWANNEAVEWTCDQGVYRELDSCDAPVGSPADQCYIEIAEDTYVAIDSGDKLCRSSDGTAARCDGGASEQNDWAGNWSELGSCSVLFP